MPIEIDNDPAYGWLDDAQCPANLRDDCAATTAIIAYHGSPHDFDCFDYEKINHGWGAQSEGYGLYFAECASVAEWHGNEVAKQQGLRAHLYTVRIDADPLDFIDWDKPLNMQAEGVKAVLKRMGDELPVSGLQFGSWSPHRFYQVLAHLVGDDAKRASGLLRDRGIRGIKYFDADSRIGQTGTRNYALFSHDDVVITHKNGQPTGYVPETLALRTEPSAALWQSPLVAVDLIASVCKSDLSTDYRDVYKMLRTYGVPADKADDLALKRLQQSWGPSPANGNQVMKYPPERYYPEVRGSRDWMKDDLQKFLMTTPHNLDRSLSGLISDDQTRAEISAGHPPSYQVLIRKMDGSLYVLPKRIAFDPNDSGALLATSTTRIVAP
jgi:hypothetical protein